jgi:PTS system mannitol-specific IIC component
MNSPRYDEVVELLGRTNAGAEAPAAVRTRRAGRRRAGPGFDPADRDGHHPRRGHRRGRELLVAAGAVEPHYVDAMHDRERSVSTYMGNGLAIPHGTNEAKGSIRRTGISFVRFPEPIDWNGKPAEFVVGIAGAGNDHLALLNQIAQVFIKPDEVARLRAARTPEEVKEILVNTDK